MKQIARNVTAEVLTLRGLVTYYVLFFNHLEPPGGDGRDLLGIGGRCGPSTRW